MPTISQVDTNETPLDTKCGLIHSISDGYTADTLFDVKLSSYASRKQSGNLDVAEDPLMEDFVERAQFRLWTSTKPATGIFTGLS